MTDYLLVKGERETDCRGIVPLYVESTLGYEPFAHQQANDIAKAVLRWESCG